jgi:hypothetical protein
MKLTKQEQKIIADLRKGKEVETAQLSGVLKCDLFRKQDEFFSFKEMMADIEDYKNTFELDVPKGTKFVASVEDGEQDWYDDEGFGVEGKSKLWAQKYLKDIKRITKRNSK